MDLRIQEGDLSRLAEIVRDDCQMRLRADEAQPPDAAEQFEPENEVLSGGYAIRLLLGRGGFASFRECSSEARNAGRMGYTDCTERSEGSNT